MTPSRFPFPAFPNGWYYVCLSRELATGALIHRHILGQELVIYRTASGKAVAADAHCPHMGAHFGHGGEVVGEDLQCPFHHFRFDPDGACTHTPYGKALPQAHIRTHPLQELCGLILIWHHADGREPDWSPPEFETEGWSRIAMHTWTGLRSHPQETTENSVDLGHLSAVHGYESLEIAAPLRTEGPYLTSTYRMVTPRKVFPGVTVRLKTEFVVHAHGLGYSTVEVRPEGAGFEARHFVFPTPTDGDHINLTVGILLRGLPESTGLARCVSALPTPLLERMLLPVMMREYTHDVSQDFRIWQNKSYIHPPALAVGDGPVFPYRRWARQFYEGIPTREAS